MLIYGATAPLVASCATNLGQYSDKSVSDLARTLGVCEARYVAMVAGKPTPWQVVSTCTPKSNTSDEAVFQAASLSKPVVACAVLQLVQQGKLDLQAPVSSYLPDGYMHRQNPFEYKKAKRLDLVSAQTLARIPLASLLNHSSGLPNWSRGALSPEFEPGERWQYSGEGYVLLQAILRSVTGQDLDTTIARMVFEPIGMRNSRMQLTDDIRAHVLAGTSWSGSSVRLDLLEPNAAASLYTTATDYAAFLSFIYADTSLLSLTTTHQISTDRTLGLSWGCGWGIEDAKGGPYLWQWGNNPGFRAFAMMSVFSGNGFVLLTNSERGMPLMAPLLHATIPADHGVLRFPALG